MKVPTEENLWTKGLDKWKVMNLKTVPEWW